MHDRVRGAAEQCRVLAAEDQDLVEPGDHRPLVDTGPARDSLPVAPRLGAVLRLAGERLAHHVVERADDPCVRVEPAQQPYESDGLGVLEVDDVGRAHGRPRLGRAQQPQQEGQRHEAGIAPAPPAVHPDDHPVERSPERATTGLVTEQQQPARDTWSRRRLAVQAVADRQHRQVRLRLEQPLQLEQVATAGVRHPLVADVHADEHHAGSSHFCIFPDPETPRLSTVDDEGAR